MGHVTVVRDVAAVRHRLAAESAREVNPSIGGWMVELLVLAGEWLGQEEDRLLWGTGWVAVAEAEKHSWVGPTVRSVAVLLGCLGLPVAAL